MNTLFQQAALMRWRIISAAPHRLMFLIGAMQLVAVMLLWLAELIGRAKFGPPAFVIASTWVHILLMLYGVFIFFIYGFLFTVFPRWMGSIEIARTHYVAVWTLAVLGIAVIYIGLFVHRWLFTFGLIFHLGAWLSAIAVLFANYRRGLKRGLHELLLCMEMCLGAVGLAFFIYSTITDQSYGFSIARDIGLWGFLLPVFLTVSHRMIPFFTQSALPFSSVPRPAWSLAWFVGGSLLHGICELTGQLAAQFIVDAALTILALHHTVIWGLRQSFSVRLLAMLHVAFLWFGIGMALYTLQDALALAGISALGRAPLHALAIGFITSTLIAMATRVTLGHSGQALAIKAPTWYLFLALNVGVTLCRIFAEIFPNAYQTLNLFAVIIWLACLLPWAIRYTPIYLRPRADGRSG